MITRMVPIPPEMQHLPLDTRGYPIPVIVLIDNNGTPQFTINNHQIVQQMVRDDCCHICGKKLHKARWFVGGPLSAYHPRGAYNDGPLHRTCLHYAMQVCPYLAMASYSGRIDAAKLKNDGSVRVMINPTMIPERPALFVAVMVHRAKYQYSAANRWFSFRPQRPYRILEYWQNGKQVSLDVAVPLIRAALEQKQTELKAAKILLKNAT